LFNTDVKNPAGTVEMRTLQTISQVSGNMRFNGHQMVGAYVKHPSFFCEKHPGLNANRLEIKPRAQRGMAFLILTFVCSMVAKTLLTLGCKIIFFKFFEL